MIYKNIFALYFSAEATYFGIEIKFATFYFFGRVALIEKVNLP